MFAILCVRKRWHCEDLVCELDPIHLFNIVMMAVTEVMM